MEFMELTLIIGYLLALLAGITLGLIGGGGSILTVPLLVYLFHVEPVLATAYSLFVVGVSATFGAFSYMRKGLLSYKTAIVFAVPSFVAVFVSRKYLIPAIPDRLFSIGGIHITAELLFTIVLVIAFILLAIVIFELGIRSKQMDVKTNIARYKKVFLLVLPAAAMVFVMRFYVVPALPENIIDINGFTLTKQVLIMVFFALVMLACGYTMIRPQKQQKEETKESKLEFNYPLIVAEGGVVGTITGLVGAGGGFLIIPALVLLARLPIKLAVGTSLLIISVKSLIGFLGDVGNRTIDWSFLLLFTGFTIVGVIIGGYLSNHIPAEKLKTGFGWFVVVMAIVILTKELFV